jgi:hypothetical protein
VGWIKENSGGFTGGMLVLSALLALAGVGTLLLRRAALLRED